MGKGKRKREKKERCNEEKRARMRKIEKEC